MLFSSIRKKIYGFKIHYYNIFNKIIFNIKHVKYGKNITCMGKIFSSIDNSAKIEIGNNVIIKSAAKYNPIGVGNKTYFTVGKNAHLFIGNNCGLSNTAIACTKEIIIEDNVLIGAGCHLYDTDFHPLKYNDRINNENDKTNRKKIHICEGAFIGAGCYILKGVTIGKHSIIGASSVVTKNIPNNEVWGGESC